MPRDFKTFCENNKKFIDENKEKTEEYKNIIDRYKDMNQSELMSNLLNEASKLKSQGKLDTNSLNSLKETISPFLNDEQKNMLSSLINKINE